MIIIYNLLYITEKKNLLKGKLIIKGKKLKDYKKTSTHCPPPPDKSPRGGGATVLPHTINLRLSGQKRKLPTNGSVLYITKYYIIMLSLITIKANRNKKNKII